MRKIRGLGLLFACFFATSALRAQDTTAEWHKLVDSATAYIKKSQNPDGSWGGARFKNGVTGIVITGLVKSGGAKVSDEATIKGLKYIESLVNTKEGHIAGPGSNVQLSNYITCVNVMALQAANQNDKYKAVVGDAVKFLKQLQFDEASDKRKAMANTAVSATMANRVPTCRIPSFSWMHSTTPACPKTIRLCRKR